MRLIFALCEEAKQERSDGPVGRERLGLAKGKKKPRQRGRLSGA